MSGYTLGRWWKSVVALGLAGVLVCAGLVMKGSALSKTQGVRTYYLYSVSSLAGQVQAVKIWDLPFVTGESVQLSVADGQAFLEKTLLEYSATTLFVEESGGVVSYYCYSQLLPNRIALNGVMVNLHIALSGESAVVGTPIIFGGF